jgi:hypothetical protein
MKPYHWLWIIIALLILTCVLLSLEVYTLSSTVLQLQKILLKHDKVLDLFDAVEEHIEETSKQSKATCEEVTAYILYYQSLYPKSPLSYKLSAIHQESSFIINAKGPCGEHGLTQIYKPTWDYCKPKGSYYNWRDTLRFGFQLMDEYWELSRGNAQLAAMFYNGGPRILRRSERAIAMASRHGRRVGRYYEQYKVSL